eukprot:6807709-Prymnesium_polylepis.1
MLAAVCSSGMRRFGGCYKGAVAVPAHGAWRRCCDAALHDGKGALMPLTVANQGWPGSAVCNAGKGKGALSAE